MLASLANMSVKISTMVWANGPEKAADLLMMLALADNCDDYGACFPGVERLATKCRVGAKAARSTLHRLRDDGWLEIIEDGGIQTGHGRNRTNLYRLNLEYLQTTSRREEVGGESDLPSTSERPPVDIPTDLPSTGGKPSVEPSEEPSKTPPPDGDGGGTSNLKPHAYDHDPAVCCLVARWYDGWNEAHPGQKPDPSVTKRVAGHAAHVAKDRKTHEDWVRAAAAAFAAGEQGIYDIVQGMPIQRRSQFVSDRVVEEKAIYGPGHQRVLDRLAARDAKILADREAKGA